MANGAVLTITREEVAPMLAVAKSDGGSDRTRGTGFTIQHLERMAAWFASEPAALSADFTEESLEDSLGAGWGRNLWVELVTFKGDVIARKGGA